VHRDSTACARPARGSAEVGRRPALRRIHRLRMDALGRRTRCSRHLQSRPSHSAWWFRCQRGHQLHPSRRPSRHAVESLCTALTPSSKRNYDIVVRSFLSISEEIPEDYSSRTTARAILISGMMAHLRAQNPLDHNNCIGRLFALRTISMSWLAPAISLNWPTCCCARISHARPTLCHDRSPQQDQLSSRVHASQRSRGNVFLCSALPACASASASSLL